MSNELQNYYAMGLHSEGEEWRHAVYIAAEADAHIAALKRQHAQGIEFARSLNQEYYDRLKSADAAVAKLAAENERLRQALNRIDRQSACLKPYGIARIVRDALESSK